MSRRRLIWMEEHDVLVIHSRLLALDGGATGIRNMALLQSALARPRQLHAYGENPDVVDFAAAYTAGIVGNHPFVDGNKRVGFVVGVLFLELNGYQFTASEESAAQAIMELAAGTLKAAEFTGWLRSNAVRRPHRKRK